MPGKRKSWGFEDCMYLLSDSARRTEGGGGSECAMRREHRRPPIFKLGVLGHAFLAAAGVVQNAKLSLCNFVVEISEGFGSS